jgi:hypothetical protein
MGGENPSGLPCVSEEVGCGLGNGVTSRKLTSGDPCCRGEYEAYTYSVTPVTSSATGEALATLRKGCEAVLQSRSRVCFGAIWLEMANCGLLSAVTGESTGPGGTPRELARSGRGALTPNRRSRARAGRVQSSKGSTGTTRPHRPAAGWPGGGAKDPTDDPAELQHVLFW